MNRKRNLPPNVSVISLRLPTELHEQLRETARESERTISQEARRAIAQHVQRDRDEAGAAA